MIKTLKQTTTIAVMLIGMASITSVSATEKGPELQRFDQACRSDVEQYCAKVQPGDGRVASCLYAHTDLLTDECYAATSQIGVILEGVFDGIEAFYAACTADLREFCPGKQPGGGEQLSCLRENMASISPGCAAAMPTYGSPKR